MFSKKSNLFIYRKFFENFEKSVYSYHYNGLSNAIFILSVIRCHATQFESPVSYTFDSWKHQKSYTEKYRR